MQPQFTKLHNCFWTGRMRELPLAVRCVYLFLACHCDDEGYLSMSTGYMAGVLNVEEKTVIAALDRLTAKTPGSDPDDPHEGARVARLGTSQWQVLAAAEYRERNTRNVTDRVTVSRNAEKQRRYRERLKLQQLAGSNGNGNGNENVTNVTVTPRIEENRLERITKSKKSGNALPVGNEAAWASFVAVYPRPSNGRAIKLAEGRKVFDALLKSGGDLAAILAGARRFRDWVIANEKGEFVPAIPPWLRGQQWLEDYHVAVDAPVKPNEPVEGRDYWVASMHQLDDGTLVERRAVGQDSVIVRMPRIIRDGVRTAEPFELDDWRRARG